MAVNKGILTSRDIGGPAKEAGEGKNPDKRRKYDQGKKPRKQKK